MPRIDFTTIDETPDYEPLPPGRYPVTVVDVEETQTKAGDDMWNLQLMVTEGEYRNRFVFDRLVFNERAYPRVKLICACLGLDVSKPMDLRPDMLRDRTAIVTVEQREYEAANGEMKSGNEIPWAGWERDPSPVGQVERASNVPF